MAKHKKKSWLARLEEADQRTQERLDKMNNQNSESVHKKDVARIHKQTIVWLFVLTIAIEVINVIYCMAMNDIQAHTCPRSSLPAFVSLILTVASSVVASWSTAEVRKERSYVFGFTLFYIAIIVCLQFPLLYFAYGGINWCDFTF